MLPVESGASYSSGAIVSPAGIRTAPSPIVSPPSGADTLNGTVTPQVMDSGRWRYSGGISVPLLSVDVPSVCVSIEPLVVPCCVELSPLPVLPVLSEALIRKEIGCHSLWIPIRASLSSLGMYLAGKNGRG